MKKTYNSFVRAGEAKLETGSFEVDINDVDKLYTIKSYMFDQHEDTPEFWKNPGEPECFLVDPDNNKEISIGHFFKPIKI